MTSYLVVLLRGLCVPLCFMNCFYFIYGVSQKHKFLFGYCCWTLFHSRLNFNSTFRWSSPFCLVLPFFWRQIFYASLFSFQCDHSGCTFLCRKIWLVSSSNRPNRLLSSFLQRYCKGYFQKFRWGLWVSPTYIELGNGASIWAAAPSGSQCFILYHATALSRRVSRRVSFWYINWHPVHTTTLNLSEHFRSQPAMS